MKPLGGSKPAPQSLQPDTADPAPPLPPSHCHGSAAAPLPPPALTSSASGDAAADQHVPLPVGIDEPRADGSTPMSDPAPVGCDGRTGDEEGFVETMRAVEAGDVQLVEVLGSVDCGIDASSPSPPSSAAAGACFTQESHIVAVGSDGDVGECGETAAL